MTQDEMIPATEFERGAEVMARVYAGEVGGIPEGAMPFNDVMMRSLFAQVWTRDIMSIRDRRLLLMGVLAATASVDAWKVHARAALKNGELTEEQLRETLVLLAPYAGYPNVSGFIGPTESVIHAYRKETNSV
jgi:4-carboxymuconolactone decarboxylase